MRDLRRHGGRLGGRVEGREDATVEGGGTASAPDVDVQDDSSFAWVVFRQVFSDGRTHAVARKLAAAEDWGG